MRAILRVVAILLAVIILAIWWVRGSNMGLSRDRVSHKEKDPVTELEVEIYEPGFVPGIDFLGGGLAVAAVLAGSSWFFRKPAGGQST